MIEKSFEVVHSSNITNGGHGTIFQASNGDFYAMGTNSKLKVLKNNLEFKISSETFHGIKDAIINAKSFINHYSKLQYKNNMVKLQTLSLEHTIFNESARMAKHIKMIALQLIYQIK